MCVCCNGGWVFHCGMYNRNQWVGHFVTLSVLKPVQHHAPHFCFIYIYGDMTFGVNKLLFYILSCLIYNVLYTLLSYL